MNICLSTLLLAVNQPCSLSALGRCVLHRLDDVSRSPLSGKQIHHSGIRALPIFPPRAVSIHSCMPSDFFIASMMLLRFSSVTAS